MLSQASAFVRIAAERRVEVADAAAIRLRLRMYRTPRLTRVARSSCCGSPSSFKRQVAMIADRRRSSWSRASAAC